MTRPDLRAASVAAGACAIIFIGNLPSAGAAPAPQGSLRAAEHARVVGYWTPERRAAAIPRDFVLDEAGRAYLKLPGGALQPYGRSVAEAAGKTPMAKPGGGGGDTQAPVIVAGSMNPASGATIGGSYTFSAVVTDNVALRSVSFKVQKGSGRAQSFSASLGSNDTWTVPLNGFSDGAWSWWVEAKDTANLASTSPTVNFTVDTSTGGGGGGGGGGGDTVTNAEWNGGGTIQRAEGRIYFEMPSNPKATRWAGYVCSGTVMQDGTTGRSTIITAAHCVYDDANKAFARHVLFIPNQDGTTGAGTDLNCGNDPIGCWTTSFGVVDVNWTTRTFPDNVAWDYAYYVVADSGAHTAGLTGASDVLDAAAGSMPVNFGTAASADGTAGKSSADFTWALGYSYSDDPNFMYCAEDMSTVQEPANWWLPSCGLSGGSSGGAWLQKGSAGDDGSNIGDTGWIMSVNSWGYTTSPGMAGPKLDRSRSSAECVFTQSKAISLTVAGYPDGQQGQAVTCP